MLTDTVMPGMGGRKLAERMETRQPGMKVLLMSGCINAVGLERQRRDRNDAFLQKPFTSDALARKVR